MYWFAQERLAKTHRLGDIPRYTAKDAEEFIARNRDIVIRPGPNGLTLGDLWKHTVSSSLVAIEEAKFKLWHWGRIACAGDSIHKSTPNLGIGGNLAIESAAVLANGIKRLADTSSASGRRPTREEIERMLSEYQTERELRAASAVDVSGALARAHNINGPMAQFLVNFVMPQITEFLPVFLSNIVIGAAKLDFLPLPLVSLTGTQPFNPKQGDGFRESKLRRMLVGLPLIVLAVAALFTMNSLPSLDWARALRDSGRLELDSGSVPIRRTLYHISWIDDLISLVNIYFFPSIYGTDAASRRQVISFLTDGTVLLTIWICESVRRANMLTIMQWCVLFFSFPSFSFSSFPLRTSLRVPFHFCPPPPPLFQPTQHSLRCSPIINIPFPRTGPSSSPSPRNSSPSPSSPPSTATYTTSSPPSRTFPRSTSG